MLWTFIPGHVEPMGELVFSYNYSGKTNKVDGGYLTDFNFPGFLVGRRSLEQSGGTQSNGNDQYVCLHTAVDFEAGHQVSNYINSEHRIVNGYHPFAEDKFSDIVTVIKRPQK